MKMQASVVAERAGKLIAVHVKVGDSVEAKDFVAEII
jgi:biotin carboxyl carrier protein